MAGWDFTADSDIQRDLSDALNKAADNFDGKVDEMYGAISGLSDHWVGEDYDLFGERTDSYKPALKDLSNGIRMFGTQFSNIADATDTLSTDLIDIITNMTGTTGGGSGANPVTPGDETGGSDIPGGGAGDTDTPGVGTGSDSGTPVNTTRGESYTDENGYTCYDYTDENGNVVYTEKIAEDGSYYYDTNGNLISYGEAPTVNQNSDGSYSVVAPNTTGDAGEEGNPTFEETPVPVEKESFWGKVGGRYVEDWDDFTGDVSNRWANADGLISGAFATLATVGEFGEFVADGVTDTAEGIVDAVDWGANWLFDLGTGRGGSTSGDYWSNIGQDYAENWDFSTVDNFGEGVGVVLTGTVRTVVDAGQTVVNAVDTAFDWVCDGVDWVGDKVGDFIGTVGGWIFG